MRITETTERAQYNSAANGWDAEPKKKEDRGVHTPASAGRGVRMNLMIGDLKAANPAGCGKRIVITDIPSHLALVHREDDTVFYYRWSVEQRIEIPDGEGGSYSFVNRFVLQNDPPGKPSSSFTFVRSKSSVKCKC